MIGRKRVTLCNEISYAVFASGITALILLLIRAVK